MFKWGEKIMDEEIVKEIEEVYTRMDKLTDAQDDYYTVRFLMDKYFEIKNIKNLSE